MITYYERENKIVTFKSEDSQIEVLDKMPEHLLKPNLICKANFAISNNEKVKKLMLCFVCTTKCNFQCKYCYESANEQAFNSDDFSEQLFFDAYNFFRNTYQGVPMTITFFGGEPFLKINEIIQFVNSIKKNDNKVDFMIITNGSIMNDKIAEFICENFSAITFSLDGIKEIHDNQRVYKNENGTFNKVIDSIKLINSVDINKKLIKACESTLSEAYLNLYHPKLIKETFDFFDQLGFNSIALIPEYNLNCESKKIDLLAQDIVDEYFERILNENYSIRLPQMESIITNIFFKHNNEFLTCTAGKSYFAIDGNKRIFPCQVVLNDFKCKIGEIGSHINEKIGHTSKRTHTLCNKCECYFLCSSFCESIMSRATNEYPSNCQFLKLLLKNSVFKIVEIIETGKKRELVESLKKKYQ